MKPRVTIKIVIFLIACTTNCYSQPYPIPATNAEYGHLTCLGPHGIPGAGCYGSIYKPVTMDTIINSKTYQKWDNITFTRYANNKLFIIDPGFMDDSIVEAVYYDFNLEVNDSMLIPLWPDSIYAIVTKTDTIHTLNGQKRKRLKLEIDWNDPCSGRMEWVEGIGNIYSDIFYVNQIALCDIYQRVVCFSDSSGLVYKEPGFEYDCDSLENYVDLYSNIARKNHAPDLSVWPNPFTDRINIETPDDLSLNLLELYNSSGTLLLKTRESQIHAADFKRGLYILKINFQNEYYLYKLTKR